MSLSFVRISVEKMLEGLKKRNEVALKDDMDLANLILYHKRHSIAIEFSVRQTDSGELFIYKNN